MYLERDESVLEFILGGIYSLFCCMTNEGD